MRIGELDQRVTVQRATQSRTDEGEVIVDTWATVGQFWANITPISGRERIEANLIIESADTVITVRWAPALDVLTRECRLIHKTTVFDVKDIVHIKSDRRWLEFHATTGLNAG